MPSFSNMFKALAFTTTSLVPLVAGHGYIKEVYINGQTYQGYHQDVDGQDLTNVIGWHVNNKANVPAAHPSDGTVQFQNPDIICGIGASTASASASITAGSTLGTLWGSGDPSVKWPHYRGIIMNYMASCSGDCSSIRDSSQLQWFKVDQKRGTPPSSWAISGINANGQYSFTIPSSVPEGDYVLRQELINLDLQWAEEDVSMTYALDSEKKSHPYYGAQVYPGCINLKVSNSANKGSAPQGIVGTQLYSAQDRSFTMNVYDLSQVGGYPMPGPPVIEGGSFDVQSTGSQTSGGGYQPAQPQTTGSVVAGMRRKRSGKRRGMTEE